MSNSDELKKNLEKQVVTFLLDEVENLRLSPDQVKIIASFFLDLIPENASDEEVAKILSKLDTGVFELIKKGDFEKAIKILGLERYD